MTSGTGNRGVTLIELTVVGLVLGLITLIAWPSVRGPAKRAVLRAEADRADLDARFARRAALLSLNEDVR